MIKQIAYIVLAILAFMVLMTVMLFVISFVMPAAMILSDNWECYLQTTWNNNPGHWRCK